MDSSDTPIFATAKNMDCHATATQRLAMTASNTASEKVDSKETAQNVDKSPNEKSEIVPDKISQVAGFLMKKRGCAAFCAEIRLSVYRTSKRQAPRFFAKSQHQNQTKHKHPK